jgi:hypothetical protein
MASMEHPRATDRKMEIVQSIWKKVRTHLEDAKARIYEEARNYPRPIPACDQQFNYLLEERVRICRELDRLDEAASEGLTPGDCVQRIDEFIQSCSYLADAVAQEIRSALKEGISRLET